MRLLRGRLLRPASGGGDRPGDVAAITAAYPFLSAMFGGFQSARTIHFFASVVLVLFLLVHVVMIIKSGFKRQMRAMTFGKMT